MRIAYIGQRPIPSREANTVHVMKMCQALQQQGHKVRLIAPLSPAPAAMPKNELFHHYGIARPFEIHLIGGPLPWTFPIRAVHLARKTRCDLIYTRSTYSALMAACWGSPTVYEMHGPPAGRWAPRYFRGIYRSKAILRIVVISEALQEEIRESFLFFEDADRIIIAADGVDLERFEGNDEREQVRGKLGLPFSGFLVGYSGHLYPGRGIELILALARRFADINFIVVGGEESDISNWRERARDKDISNISFIGFVANALVPPYLMACDVLLMPYQKKVSVQGWGDTSRWCSPMKMFEYMASGRVIISSDLPVL